ncbi:MAG: hypothetical protein RBT63_10680 [Bdellovibrionales bacterium]|jgi:hypothetical protein|nr:hypothetical protein [Bdellovibrionales bacterium]
MDFDCHPDVASAFHPHHVITGLPCALPIFIHEATIDEWKAMAAKWEEEERRDPIMALGLETASLH